MIRPILEYDNTAPCPTYENDKVRIEKIEGRATRLITEVSGLPYEERP